MTAGKTPGGGAAASAIELLSSMPGIESEGVRQALLLTAGLDSALVEAVPTAGSAAGFCAVAVEACIGYGALADRRPALEALLEGSSSFGDVRYRARVREFVGEYRRELSSPQGRWRAFLARLGVRPEAVPTGPLRGDREDLAVPEAADRVAELLAREHVVVLLGEPHADTLPTAVDLLWRAFRDHAMQPRWLTATTLDPWVQEPGGLPRQVDTIVPSGSAAHVDDPFGELTPTDVEQFLTDLGDLARQVTVRDSLLIVTSTSRVFARVARPAFPGLVGELPDELSRTLPHELRREQGADAAGGRAGAVADARSEDVARWAPERLLAVLVVDLLADTDAVPEDAEALYLAVVGADAAQDRDRNWDAVLAASRDDVVDLGALRPFPLQLRDPSTREALRRHVQGSPEAADLSQQLVARAGAAASLSVRLAALRALLRQPALWRNRTWAAPILDAFLNSPDTLARRRARFAAVASLPEMPPDLRASMLDDARQHWNDRFLLRLALHGDLDDDERGALVGRLAGSWDRWVRAVAAKNLHHLGADPAVLSVLLRDEDRQVAREAARAVLAHQHAWRHAAASPADLLTDELRRDPSIRPLLDKDSPT
jgi:Effector-associated domain 8